LGGERKLHHFPVSRYSLTVRGRAQCQLTCCTKFAGRFSAKAAAPSRPSGDAVNRSSADIARLDRPAWWSVSALNDCLRKRSAVGLFAAISTAHALVSLISRSAGTTAFTRPQRSAVGAS